MSGGRRTRLSALVVNYESGPFCVRCVESLRAAWAHEGRRPEDLEIVVCDNASPGDQEPWLARIEELSGTVVRHDRNDGYAAGMNVAYARSSGGARDVVAVLNPDLFFLPGSIAPLLAELERPDCGAVGPRAFIDPARELNLPRNTMPTVTDAVRVLAAQVSPALCRAYSRRRTRAALPWWSGGEPFDAPMISGCCMLMRREVVDRIGRLMDERYPLYFEDTDLCRELARRGYRIVYHPGSVVLHHWSRSTGPVGGGGTEPFRRYEVSRRLYFEKFTGRAGRLVTDLVAWLSRRWPPRLSFRPMHAIADLGAFEGPVVIPLPRSCRFLLELTMAPTWILAVGITGEGERWTCPEETWEWFFQAEYFMRAVDLDTGEVLGAWRFFKTTPGREAPLPLESVPEYARAGAPGGAVQGDGSGAGSAAGGERGSGGGREGAA